MALAHMKGGGRQEAVAVQSAVVAGAEEEEEEEEEEAMVAVEGLAAAVGAGNPASQLAMLGPVNDVFACRTSLFYIISHCFPDSIFVLHC